MHVLEPPQNPFDSVLALVRLPGVLLSATERRLRLPNKLPSEPWPWFRHGSPFIAIGSIGQKADIVDITVHSQISLFSPGEPSIGGSQVTAD